MNVRERLVEMAERTLVHVRAGTTDRTDSVMTIPATHYYDPSRWQDEVEQLFKRVPLLVATSAELREPNSYRALEICGIPIIVWRDDQGEVRAFVNMCSHRGAMLVSEGCGTARRLSCPYHAWTYDQRGELVGIYKREDFGDIDTSCLGLTGLRVIERAGLVWVVLSGSLQLDVDAFFAGYDELLGYCDFSSMNHLASRRLAGPNWKVAFDGYVDFYHLPILHKDTFGPSFPSEAVFHRVGPHQRVTVPRGAWSELEGKPSSEWPDSILTAGVWSVFPHASIAGFALGEHTIYQVARIYPGEHAEESITELDFITTAPLTEEYLRKAQRQIDFLEKVVRDEDYFTGLRIQRNVRTGAKKEFVFGRNEGGAQWVHRWINAILEASDDQLDDLFRRGISTPTAEQATRK